MGGFHIENFGCRATQADGAAIERALLKKGCERSQSAQSAAVVVLNSCTVTASADADLRAEVRRIHRANPFARILVTGCYAQRAPEEVAALAGVTWVVGNSHKNQVAEIALSGLGVESQEAPCALDSSFAAPDSVVSELPISADIAASNPVPSSNMVSLVSLLKTGTVPHAPQLVSDIFAHTELMAAPVFEPEEHGGSNSALTRPNLKVQDGCDNRCSFCVIPFVRGRSRSLPLAQIVNESRSLVAAGFKELVISGINLGRWGRDLPRPARFEELIRALLADTDLARLRISSIEPMDWSDELIALVAGSPRICKHAHVPLQSGSDQVLRMMHRRYRPWHYAAKLRALREAMPDAAIGADVMVGFPGETEEMFAESRDFIERLPFTYLHVFTFSSRPGTAAEKLPGQVPASIAKERNRVLRGIAAAKNLSFREGFLGDALEMITLQTRDQRGIEALSHNYLKVHIEGDLPPNILLRAKITAVTAGGLRAHL